MIRTIGELIEELQKWPASGIVSISERPLHAPDSCRAYAILEVKGYAGGMIDGSDSGVSLVPNRAI